MSIKTVIQKIVVAIVMTPLVIIAIILYFPYALYRGVLDDFIANSYYELWGKALDFLLYPITYIGGWKARCNTLEGKLQYYKDRCKQLENELNKENKQ